ncbi:hypothetical protein E2C01_083634 [Portunus trituberculatus]|uniref:Uncharacterized protein n=1 Tax=Portunus trituberculatus TaxID=210409 RepID=A0A5B7J1S5_PORTR|nr:hypothetical protein [Portunus trituberculatus]
MIPAVNNEAGMKEGAYKEGKGIKAPSEGNLAASPLETQSNETFDPQQPIGAQNLALQAPSGRWEEIKVNLRRKVTESRENIDLSPRTQKERGKLFMRDSRGKKYDEMRVFPCKK